MKPIINNSVLKVSADKAPVAKSGKVKPDVESVLEPIARKEKSIKKVLASIPQVQEALRGGDITIRVKKPRAPMSDERRAQCVANLEKARLAKLNKVAA